LKFPTGGTLCKFIQKTAVKSGGLSLKMGGWRSFGRSFLGRFLAVFGTATLTLVLTATGLNTINTGLNHWILLK